MWEEGETATAEMVDAKLQDLHKVYDPIGTRADERQKRPETLQRLQGFSCLTSLSWTFFLHC